MTKLRILGAAALASFTLAGSAFADANGGSIVSHQNTNSFVTCESALGSSGGTQVDNYCVTASPGAGWQPITEPTAVTR